MFCCLRFVFALMWRIAHWTWGLFLALSPACWATLGKSFPLYMPHIMTLALLATVLWMCG